MKLTGGLLRMLVNVNRSLPALVRVEAVEYFHQRPRKLGLELKRQEDTLPIYTAERIERPAAN
jgi:hypothetical protein